MKERVSTLMGSYVKWVVYTKNYSKQELINQFEKYGLKYGICAYCGSDKGTSLDHINSPVIQSGFSGFDNDIRNLVPCCPSCNSSKGKKTIDEWLYNSDTLYVKNLKSKPEFEARIKIVENYIKKNKSNEPVIPEDLLKELNTRARMMKKRVVESLDEFEETMLKDREYYNKRKSK